MITIELVLFIAITSMLFNVISFWAITRMRDSQLMVFKRLWPRLHYIEVVLEYHGLIPLPWEVEEIKEYRKEIKSFKQDGNIVYLQQED